MQSFLQLATLYSWISIAPIALALALVASAQLGALAGTRRHAALPVGRARDPELEPSLKGSDRYALQA